ncbi:MAG: SDR family NAD(P)-dependent oxidoreductase [Bdellovibrionota bacterium]
MHKSEKGWALITGASAGIGEATALRLDQEGYSLLLVARRSDRLKKLQDKLKNPSQIFSVDLQKPSAISEFLKNAETQLKNVTVLVNNAGLAKGTEKFQDAALADFDAMIDTNVKALIAITRGVLPYLLKNKKGHIVNIGSVAGRWVYPGGAVYAATKFAVRALSDALRMDLMGTGIRVTNIEPGMVESEFSLVRLGDKEKADKVYSGMTPLTPSDIAETLSWCLDRPAHVNIQELVIFPTDQAGVGPSYVDRRV